MILKKNIRNLQNYFKKCQDSILKQEDGVLFLKRYFIAYKILYNDCIEMEEL